MAKITDRPLVTATNGVLPSLEFGVNKSGVDNKTNTDQLKDDSNIKTINSQTINYTILNSDDVILASNAITITLPVIANAYQKIFTIKNIGTDIVTLQGNGAELIDEYNTYNITPQNESVSIIHDSTKWRIITDAKKDKDQINSLYINTGDLYLDSSIIFGITLTDQNLGLFSGLTNSSWYFVGIREDTFTVSNILASSLTKSGWNPSIASNQLDLNGLYEKEYNYCRFQSGGNWYRLLYIFKTNSASTSFEIYNEPLKIKHKPYTYAVLTSDASTGVASDGAIRYIEFPSLFIDTLSEISGSTVNRSYTSSDTKNIIMSISINIRVRTLIAGGSFVNYNQFVYLNGNQFIVSSKETVGNASVVVQNTFSFYPDYPLTVSKGSILDLRYSSGNSNIDVANTSFNYNSNTNGMHIMYKEEAID